MDEERRTHWLEEEKRSNALMEEEERSDTSKNDARTRKPCRQKQAEDEERRWRKFRSEMKETVNNSFAVKMREAMGDIVPQIMAAVSKKKKMK